jgi:membrane protease YdiL (CAAX protease family)
MTRSIWQVVVIIVVLGTVLVAPTWETLFAATVAVILNHVGRPDWRVDFGLRAIPWRHPLLMVLAGIALFFAVKLFLQPLCDLITHSTRNLHSFDRIGGRPAEATLLILKTMLLAGLCEEVIFRGTVQQRARVLFERIPGCTVLTIIIASAIFTSFHWYQGPSGLRLATMRELSRSS